jgi:hypothetical protein
MLVQQEEEEHRQLVQMVFLVRALVQVVLVEQHQLQVLQ